MLNCSIVYMLCVQLIAIWYGRCVCVYIMIKIVRSGCVLVITKKTVISRLAKRTRHEVRRVRPPQAVLAKQADRNKRRQRRALSVECG